MTVAVSGLAALAILILLSGPDYQLTPQARLLLSKPDAKMTAQVSYNSSKHEYAINKKVANHPVSPNPTVLVGQPSTGLYSATLPDNLARGIRVTNNTDRISLTLQPMFKTAAAKEESGHFVYPGQGGVQAVYTPQAYQLAEDLILNHPIGNDLSLAYRIGLPKGLTTTPGSNGTVIISSKGDPLFELAAPTVIESNGHQGGKPASASARLMIKGTKLTLVASGLTHLTYPVVIDPSILVSSATGFTTGNNEGDITATANQFSESGLSGAELNTWTATTSLSAGFDTSNSVAYNGYVYEIGGTSGAIGSSSGSSSATVDYAPINSNGTLGSWTATTSLPTATFEATSVTYDGYVYEIGGLVSGGYTTTVDYAPINSNGTLGGWTSTTSLPTANDSATSVVYNGYVYEIGGCSASCPTTTVDYAPINSNGTLGSWTATTNLPTAAYQATSVAYDGYVYELGGNTGSAATVTVDYAAINSNGTLGSWTATTSLPVGTRNATSVVYNGYVYEIGGCSSTCNIATVDYAAINSNGTLGSWTATSSLPAATYDATSVAYDGYVYEIGGDASGGYTATVDYAQIKPAGYTSAYTSTTSLPVATYDATSVAYNGYAYEIGGSTNSGAITTVNYAPVNSNGTLGSWTATTSLPVATDNATSVVYNGYVYEIGGSISSSVDYAPVNSNGTLGSWTATTSLPAATYEATSVVYNGYVYEIGGCNSTGCYSTTVDYAPINSNGTLGSWSATSSLPVATGEATSVVYNGYVYEIGGDTGSVTATVDYAPINSNGSLGSWTATTSLPVAIEGAASVAYNGYVYEIGGDKSGGYISTVDYAPVNSNGTLGSWTATTSLPATTAYATAVTYDGYICEMGGYDTSTVDYATINNGGPGTVGSWNSTSSFAGDADFTSVTYKGYVYGIGGYPGSAQNGVYYAPINSNGTLGSWTATTSLPMGTGGATSVVYNGYVYEIGGYNGTSDQSTVDYAPINSNGSLGSWTATTSLPVAIEGAASVAYNGYVYEIGGYNGTSDQSTVDYAPINSNGTLGSWTATTSLPTATAAAASVTYNGYVYNIGGSTSGVSGTPTNVVDYAPINSNGTLGSWTATTSLPMGVLTTDTVTYDGYVYILGGQTSSYNTNNTASVDYAPINSNGTLGPWTATTSLPYANEAATSVAYNGYVYEIDGANGISYYNTVYYAALNSIPRVGQYSMLVNLAPAYNLTWNTATSLPTATDSATSVSYNGYIYEIGGYNGSSATATVDYSSTNVNGSINGWSSTTNLPVATENATSVSYNGYIYEIGGYNGTSAVATVDYAPINSNGTLGSWTATTSLPAATDEASSVVYNGYLYEIGGCSSTCPTSAVDYAPINSNGTLGSWTATTSLPVALQNESSAAVVYNGYLYQIGGCSSSTFDASCNQTTVDYAPINSNGTLGNWTATTALPYGLTAPVVTYGGDIYTIGGFDSGGGCDNKVLFAPINNNATLGSWTSTTGTDYGTVCDISPVVADGVVYAIGGANGGPLSNVAYASLIDPDVTPDAIVVNGSNPGNPGIGGLANGAYSGLGGITVQYENGTAQCTTLSSPRTVDFGGQQLGEAYKLDFSSDGCGMSTDLSEYTWVHFTLDDTQTATFPDVNGNHTTITSFQIFFHAAAQDRLRGGMTLQNGVLQSLDAPPTTTQ